ncbi:MAG: F0F1 ATP synthase subunit A [Tepidanaerobacteraceae bacterium]|jgi:F-type H+-transporting ATPase subunit a|nr:F0F1 ATP synthase subunit A [Tepidanaerobacteraceae bacterium]
MEFFPKVIFIIPLYGMKIPVTETVVVTWGIMAGLMAFGYAAGKNLERMPHGLQNGVEIFYEGLEGLIESTMGEGNEGFVPYIGTLAMYLAVANLIGLLAFRPPTADLSTTLTLAGITFALTQYEGLRKKGVTGYIRGFFEPLPFMAPLNIIGQIANPFSMAFRLFGNILGGMIIMNLAYSAMPVIIPAPLHFYFDVFAGVLQTFIFIMLTMTFVGMAAE